MAKKTAKTKSAKVSQKMSHKTVPSKKVLAKPKAKPAVKPAKANTKISIKKEVIKKETKRPEKALAKITVATAANKKNDKNKVSSVKPALMTKKGSKINAASDKSGADQLGLTDQGDLLIEMAKNEMSKVSGDPEKAEKASKFKSVKILKGNAADEKAKWIELNKRYGKDKPANYKMSEAFDSTGPIMHKTMGWGFILSNDNDRLEVLFENGIKMLISNYKPT